MTNLLTCRYRFLTANLLRLHDVAFETVTEIDVMTQGSVLHRVAEELFPPGPPPSAVALKGQFSNAFRRAVLHVGIWMRLPQLAFPLDRLRSDAERFAERLGEFLRSSKLSIIGTELVFGRDEGEEILAPLPGGRPFKTILVTGRMDLLAITEGGRSHVVIDVKRGKVDKYHGLSEEGLAPQMPIYAIGCEGKFGKPVSAALYYSATREDDPMAAFRGSKGGKERIGLQIDEDAWAEEGLPVHQKALLKRVAESIEAYGRPARDVSPLTPDQMRAYQKLGLETCDYCDHSLLCRVPFEEEA